MDPAPIEVSVVYIRPIDGGWSMTAGADERHFATATGAIYEGIQHGRALARTGPEVWVLWRNGEAWSVAWTSDADRPLTDRIGAYEGDPESSAVTINDSSLAGDEWG